MLFLSASFFVLISIFQSQLCRASPLSQSLVLHESIDVLPKGWRYHSSPDDAEIVSLSVALRQSHHDYIKVAERVSNPASHDYGKYLSADELRRYVPSMESQAAAVQSWFFHNNIAHSHFTGDEWVVFNASVGQLRSLLGASFDWYSFDGSTPVLRTRSYGIPSHLSTDIDFIYPSIHFMSLSVPRESTRILKARQHVPIGPVTCSNNICPQNLTSMYNINYYPRDNKSKSTLGVAGFLEQYPDEQDLNQFLGNYSTHKSSLKKPFTYSVQKINGGKNPDTTDSAGVEAMLDMEYTSVFTGPLNLTFYSTGGRPPTLNEYGNASLPASQSQNEPWSNFLEYLLTLKNPPQVISMSYSDTEQTVPIAYAQRVCNLFARLAARGVSCIGASGDGGASGTNNGDCVGPDGKERFEPTFPSSCPWITSIGATAIYGGAASFSSGGFSNFFATPSWQKTATQTYIKELKGKHNKFYNATGRGIPDLSVVGDDYLIVHGGFQNTADGTSASTPVFASMIALLNDLRLRAGKPVLGFLNPLLYSNLSSAFKDVADGSNINGCSNGNTFEVGFEALKGWDAATGLGTPDFVKLRQLLKL